MGVITTCPQNPAKPSNKNMLALVVEEEETRATKRVKMKCNLSNQTNNSANGVAQRDLETQACRSGHKDSPACWLANGAMFKAFQAQTVEWRWRGETA